MDREAPKRFDASFECFFLKSPSTRGADGEYQAGRSNGRVCKDGTVKGLRMESIADVLEEVGDLIDTYFFNRFSETKSSEFLRKVIKNQGAIDTSLFKKTWRTLNCSHKQ